MGIRERYSYVKWYAVRYARCLRTHVVINAGAAREAIGAKLDRAAYRLWGILPPR